ncbi:MAG TPA: NAD(P)-binding domain-containing protein [Gemmatimonadaceae bacterium]|nr:NAD(P)-binding domain-containing protein [Gemmatimonadaceae bacterium]
MRIAILGAGLMGAALGRLWAQRGDHAVTFTYSRDPKKLERLAAEVGARAAASPADAVRDCDAVLVAVPWVRLDDAIARAGGAGAFAGRVVVTCSLPMEPGDNFVLALGLTTSGAEELARRLPAARVVSAFNTVPSELLHESVLRTADARPEVVVCGDDDGARQVAEQLVRDAGCEPMDAGPLRIARYTEPFALLVAQLAYERGMGPALGYRFVRAEAEEDEEA